MNVNITGKGLIPVFNVHAPAYNKDVDKDFAKRLLAYRNFRLYKSDDNTLITMKNLDAIFDNKNVVVEKKVVEPIITTSAVHAPVSAPIVTEIIVEEKKEEYVEPVLVVEETPTVIEEPTPVEETTGVEVIEEALPEITEENIDEVKEAEVADRPHHNNRRRNKKNRNNNNE